MSMNFCFFPSAFDFHHKKKIFWFRNVSVQIADSEASMNCALIAVDATLIRSLLCGKCSAKANDVCIKNYVFHIQIGIVPLNSYWFAYTPLLLYRFDPNLCLLLHLPRIVIWCLDLILHTVRYVDRVVHWLCEMCWMKSTLCRLQINSNFFGCVWYFSRVQ